MWFTNGIEPNRKKKEEQAGRDSAEDPPYAGREHGILTGRPGQLKRVLELIQG